ncbi:hypothetical protein T01_16193 [Trichinella spiralis]|uniref:Uncharacterized protein n=1 Tax=Trichinella spiralis TaxID=6334 RepID=A0A0V1BDR8_TRISP|nr:hypothetical protein T01_16193 [Trichinella spiralis]
MRLVGFVKIWKVWKKYCTNLKNVNGRIDFNNLPTTYDSPLFSRGGKMRDDAVIIFTKKDPQRPCVLRLLVQLGYTFSSSNQVARVIWWEGWN